jgi:hypothetical protein
MKAKIVLPGWLAIATIFLGGIAAKPQAAEAQRVIAKTCTHCGHAVPLSSQVGDVCPYCGACWGGEQSKYVFGITPSYINPPQLNLSGCTLLGSVNPTPPRPKAAMDIIKWPALLQEPAFISQRRRIEAPYRRSPPDRIAPTSNDYRDMVASAEEMRAILDWFTKKGVDTQDYEQANRFLTKLEREASKRSETGLQTTPQNVQAVVASGRR